MITLRITTHSSGPCLTAWCLRVNGQMVAGGQCSRSVSAARLSALVAFARYLSTREAVAQIALSAAFSFAVVGLCFAFVFAS